MGCRMLGAVFFGQSSVLGIAIRCSEGIVF